MQCSNGHTLCSGCEPRVHNRCPTYRHELGNIRCLALETVVASIELPCKCQSFECIGIYPYYSKLKHGSECHMDANGIVASFLLYVSCHILVSFQPSRLFLQTQELEICSVHVDLVHNGQRIV